MFALDFSYTDWLEWALRLQLPKYVAKQIYCWIYQKQALNPSEFTNLSRAVRSKLAGEFSWELPTIDSHLISEDQSEKFLLKTHDQHLFEMVLMPSPNRVTLCVSSQVGCKRGCTFCQTGKMGLKRNLTAGEILSQVFLANRRIQERIDGKKVTNVVFMGMGEPLDNYKAVVQSCAILIDPEGLCLSKHRVTVSTSGLIPEILQLGKDLPVRLAISLHSADEEKRSQMMPVNRTYPLHALKAALAAYPAPQRYGITIEYVMIEQENDSLLEAKKLANFLQGIRAKVNLIPLNHFPGMPIQASKQENLLAFQKYLIRRHIPTSIRYSRGQDISGGCGQLAAKNKQEIHLDPRWVHKKRRRQGMSTNPDHSSKLRCDLLAGKLSH